MTVFALALLKFKDREAYQRYQERFMPILMEFGGRLLAADENPDTIEGIWEGDKVVLISFTSRERFAAWSQSPSYQEIARDRRSSVEATVLLLKGIVSSA